MSIVRIKSCLFFVIFAIRIHLVQLYIVFPDLILILGYMVSLPINNNKSIWEIV